MPDDGMHSAFQALFGVTLIIGIIAVYIILSMP